MANWWDRQSSTPYQNFSASKPPPTANQADVSDLFRMKPAKHNANQDHASDQPCPLLVGCRPDRECCEYERTNHKQPCRYSFHGHPLAVQPPSMSRVWARRTSVRPCSSKRWRRRSGLALRPYPPAARGDLLHVLPSPQLRRCTPDRLGSAPGRSARKPVTPAPLVPTRSLNLAVCVRWRAVPRLKVEQLAEPPRGRRM